MNPTDTSTAPLNFGQDELSRTEILEISLRAIRPDPDQPRRYFDEEAQAELRDSMALYGLLQPVGVRQSADGSWELIFGERRYWFWLVGNSLGLTAFVLQHQWITALLYVYFTVSCVQGLRHWTRAEVVPG